MKRSYWRPFAILALGLVTLFGVGISRTLLGDRVPEIWLQVIAGAGALYLLWQEWRERDSRSRWRLLAWLGGLAVLIWVGGIAILWLIWPT